MSGSNVSKSPKVYRLIKHKDRSRISQPWGSKISALLAPLTQSNHFIPTAAPQAAVLSLQTTQPLRTSPSPTTHPRITRNSTTVISSAITEHTPISKPPRQGRWRSYKDPISLTNPKRQNLQNNRQDGPRTERVCTCVSRTLENSGTVLTAPQCPTG